jgi:hypothetical protein
MRGVDVFIGISKGIPMKRAIIFPLVLMLLALACNQSDTALPESPNFQTTRVASPDSLRIVYTDSVDEIRGGDLWIIDGAAASRQLTVSGQDASPQFSDDGQLAAFRRIVEPILDVEELWVIDAGGGEARVLVSNDWLSAARSGERTSIFRAEWVPGTHMLAFTIAVVYEEPGFLVDENLYLVNADDGHITTAIPPGAPLALFFYSPEGARIALTSPTAISLVDIGGGGWREVVAFKGTGFPVWVGPPTELFYAPRFQSMAC